MADLATLLASLPPSRPLPRDLRIAKYADIDDGKRFIAQAAIDGYASVCVPPSLYAALGRMLTPGRQVWDINGVRVVEEMYLRDGEIVAFPRPGVRT